LFRAYSKPSNIGLTTTAGANQSYGVGVVYSKSFNSFRDLFKREKIKSDTVSANTNKIDSVKNRPNK
jgi:hypothetical protein